MTKHKKSLLGFILIRFLIVELILGYFVLVFLEQTLDIPLFENRGEPIASRIFYDDGKTELGRYYLGKQSKNDVQEALYFKEHIRKELKNILSEKDDQGYLKLKNPDGRPWDMYADGLKIYTTLNRDLQQHAEQAMKTHLSIMQPQFREQLKNLKHFPYSNDMTKEQVGRSLSRAIKYSDRWYLMNEAGKSKDEIKKAFHTPIPMRVFSWQGEIDTIMTPFDSILHYKTFLRAGMISIEPQSGFVKAWVGGADIRHFNYDCVSQAKRQVGSLIKPFVYSTGLAMGVVEPCTVFNGGYCVGNWCPGGKAAGTFADGLIYNRGTSTVAVLSKMGPLAGKENIAKFLSEIGIDLPRSQITPPMVLGTMSLSLKEIISAYTIFPNQGIYTSPTSIFRIEDRCGNIIYESEPKVKEVLSQNLAYTILNILEKAVNQGVSKRLRADTPFGNILYPTAGKTGTTQNNSDAWFVGMTPDLVTGVWTGGEERSIRWKWTGIGQGASAALPMYGYFMNSVYADSNINISKKEFRVPVDYAKAWPNCHEKNPLFPKTDSIQKEDGEYYYFYKEPEKSDEDNPFL